MEGPALETHRDPAHFNDGFATGIAPTIPGACDSVKLNVDDPHIRHESLSTAESNALVECEKQQKREDKIVNKHVPQDPLDQLLPLLILPSRFEAGARSHQWTPDSVRALTGRRTGRAADLLQWITN